MKKLSKLLSVVMAVVLMLTMAVPSFAADTDATPGVFRITITNPTAQNGSDKGHTYEAYQIFSGTLNATSTKLSTIEWGAHINGETLLTNLAASDMLKSHFSSCKTAQEVADAISQTSFAQNKELVKLFAQVVNASLKAKSDDNQPYISNCNLDEDGNVIDYTIDIPMTKPGYYLIKDADGSLTGKENKDYTEFMLQITSDKTVQHKGSIPTVTKKVSENGRDDMKDDLAVLMGRDYYYHLIGTMPEDINSYDTYEYIFTDTMANTIDYRSDEEDPIKVYLRRNKGSVEILLDKDTHNYTVSYDAAKRKLVIEFQNIKWDLNGDKVVDDKDLQPSDEIVVVYKARLNSDAVEGQANLNTVVLEYSNNPNGTGTGTTNPSIVRTYTFKLNIFKYNVENNNPLSGAEFVLYRKAAVSGGNTVNEYAVIGADGKIVNWVTDIDTAGTKVTSNADGNINIIGLAKGDYYLKETQAPDGFNLLISDIHINIIATAANDKIATFTATSNANGITTADKATCTITVNVSNRSGATLPTTGGVGTTMLYIVGAALTIGSIVALVTKKRMDME